MIKRLLIKDPDKRMSVKEALEHPWLLYHLGKIKRNEIKYEKVKGS